MGSSTVELSLDPIVLQNQTFTTKKTHHMLCFFNLSFFFFFPNKMFISLSTARLRFVQTPTPSGQHWNIFFQTFFFSFKKTSCSQKKREFLIFFSKPKFFLPCVSFSTKEKKRSKMKNTIRERRYPERFSPYFLYFKIWWRDGVSTCSWKLPICYKSTLQIYIQHFRMQLYKD